MVTPLWLNLSKPFAHGRVFVIIQIKMDLLMIYTSQNLTLKLETTLFMIHNNYQLNETFPYPI